MFASANFKRPIAALALMASCSTACAPAVSSCPPIVEYEQAVLDRAAGEVELLGPGAATAILLADYAVLRDQLRACR